MNITDNTCSCGGKKILGICTRGAAAVSFVAAFVAIALYVGGWTK